MFRICDQLAEYGLIEWKPVRQLGGIATGIGKISGAGVSVIEGATRPPANLPISLTVDRSITVHGSSNVQVGNSNTQTVKIDFGRLIEAIDESSAPEAQKAEAKGLVARLSENPPNSVSR